MLNITEIRKIANLNDKFATYLSYIIAL